MVGQDDKWNPLHESRRGRPDAMIIRWCGRDNDRSNRVNEIDRWIGEIAEAGQRLSQLGALEGAAGNISLFLPLDTSGLDSLLTEHMPRARAFELPGLSGLPPGAIIVTGTGRRLRDVALRP